MSLTRRAAALLSVGLIAAAGAAPPARASSRKPEKRVVVIVSGGGATSPFTTPTEACKKGFAAGSSDTALREALLTTGFAVYTSPAQVGAGAIESATGEWGFSGCPAALPAVMTVNSMGPVDDAGKSLATFLEHLRIQYGVSSVDLVAHSMGGLYSRSAVRRLKETGSPLEVRSLTTIGTPWEGSFAADYATGARPLSECGGDKVCEASMEEFKSVWLPSSTGTGQQGTRAYLAGADGWNARQGAALKGIPVTLVGGDYLRKEGGTREVWPNDNLVALSSALATGVSDDVLPHRACFTFPDLHSIYYASQRKVERTKGLTWDPRVFAVVRSAIRGADKALSEPNREGCPKAP